MSAAPLSYLSSAGTRANITLPLTWLTLAISILVCLIIAWLLWQGAGRARPRADAAATRATPVEHGGDGIRWIKLGLLLSAAPLLLTLVWTMVALARTAGPPQHPALTIDVTGHQWWWEVEYHGAGPVETFRTANEIHIPAGVPVEVRLHGADVIHSFWVPKLSGKTDTIPGQTNVSWLQADSPGRYQGQCTEYCGLQHAHMGFEVVAQTQGEFEQWRLHQLEDAPAPATADAQRGMSLVVYRCGLCHEVRGTTAGAVSAPDLTHLMSRRMLAAGSLLNNPGNLLAWIENPQVIKPGSLMPEQHLSAQQLSDLRAYLESLQ
ncbi:MAG: cytochrome c oxidase subunit II [Steroidobacteraceae bacterium]